MGLLAGNLSASGRTRLFLRVAHFFDHKGRKGHKGVGVDHPNYSVLEMHRVGFEQETQNVLTTKDAKG